MMNAKIEDIGNLEHVKEKIEKMEEKVKKEKKQKRKEIEVSVKENFGLEKVQEEKLEDRKEEKQEEDKKKNSEEFPEFEIGFDPFQDQTAK